MITRNVAGRFVAIALLFFISLKGNAQTTIEALQRIPKGAEELLFKITPAQASYLVANNIRYDDTTFFQNFVQVVKDEDDINRLPYGHYLKVNASGPNLVYDYVPVSPFILYLPDNKTDLMVQLNARNNGQIINTAMVTIDGQKMPFDAATKAYRLPKSNRKGILDVQIDSAHYYYQIDKSQRTPSSNRLRRSIFRFRAVSLILSPPMLLARLPVDGYKSIRKNKATGSIAYVKYKANDWSIKMKKRRERRAERREDRKSGKNWRSYSDEEKYTDYPFFSKPKYRLHDTVSLKVLIIDNKTKKWLKKPLWAVLHVSGQHINLGLCKPAGGSGYYYSFPLHDSMKIKPDRTYSIDLTDSTDMDYATCNFRVEEYELRKSVFRIDRDLEQHVKGRPFEIKFTAKDENELPMRDAKAEIKIMARSIGNVLRDTLFVPDLIWQHSFAVEDGVKRIVIPDSIFADADYSYTVQTSMKNSEQEKTQAVYNIDYRYHSFEIQKELSGDSIWIRALQNDTVVRQLATIIAVDRYGYYLSEQQAELPFKTQLDVHAAEYRVLTADMKQDLDMTRESSMLTCAASRNPDSVFVYISNPRALSFTYQIYERNNERLRGYGSGLDTAIAANERDIYYVAIQYVWAGKVESEMYQVRLRDKLVKLFVEQPEVIYPGKETEITITAKDYKDRPVSGMSVLTYANTAKFGEQQFEGFPDMSSPQKGKYEVNTFREASHFDDGRKQKLNYNYWNDVLTLDTNQGYRFLYPQREIEQIIIPAEDNLTQFAPFVTDSGKLEGIHYVLLNQSPVYFGFTDRKAPYSFEVGWMKYNEIRIRTKKHLVVIDSFEARQFHKTIFTVDLHRPTAHVKVIPMPDSLTVAETDRFGNYIIGVSEWDRNSSFRFLSSVHQQGVFRLDERISNQRYNSNSYKNGTTIGPLVRSDWQYKILNNYVLDFEVEPRYNYTFKPNVVKMVSTGKEQFIDKRSRCEVPQLGEWVVTERSLRSLHDRAPQKYRRTISNAENYNGQAKLKIEIESMGKDSLGHDTQPLNIILAQQGNFNVFNLYPGTKSYFEGLPAGVYDMLIMEENHIYRSVRNLVLGDSGTSFYRVKHADTMPVARFAALDSLIYDLYYRPYMNHKLDGGLIMSYYLKATYKGAMEDFDGRVKDNNGTPMKGVMILVKDTKLATVTDAEGYFSISIPRTIAAKASLVIDLPGYDGLAVKADKKKTYVLKQLQNQTLDEVSIYGRSLDRRSYVGSISTVTSNDIARRPITDIVKAIEGAAPGVQVSSGGGQPGATPDILMRGVGAVDANNSPLIIVNGAVFSGTLVSISSDIVESMRFLKDAEATAKYGAKGAHGVILITLKKNAIVPDNIKKALDSMPVIPEDIMVSGMRTDFRDDAFWHPNLITDKDGKVSFKVTFPDDLTSWNTFVYATDDKMRTGQSSGNIKSFKPVSAALMATTFLVEGDSVNFIGKAVNYTPDTMPVRNSYYVNDSLRSETAVQLAKYNNESLPLTAPRADSLKLKYMLRKDDGYFDGEEKTISILPRGVSVARGAFLTFDGGDTSITIPRAASNEPLYLSATASLIDIVIDEIEKVKQYQHLCNEQLSSKIIACLNQERIYRQLHRPLPATHAKDVQKMIDLLLQRQNGSKLWGWWGDGNTVIWISRHVMKALTEAKAMHYNIGPMNFEQMVQPLIFSLERDTLHTDVQTLKLLHAAGMKIDYEKYISRMERRKRLSLGTRLDLIRFRQELKLPYNTKLLQDFKQEDLFGNIFWKDTASYIYDNEVLTTLTAFTILQADKSIGINKHKVINWLLQQRGVNGWRNIYESSQLIEAIASDIDLNDTAALKPVLRLSGGLDKTVTTFPYQEKLMGPEAIQVNKTGNVPVYFTWYQRRWDTTDANLGANFTVQSAFQAKGKPVTTLKAGEAVELTVKVKVDKSAEFVMIDIPVPAGCSYDGKPQSSSYYGHEVHREYYKDRVSIFCEKLPRGEYTYMVKLLPRYSGNFTLNPAKTELMYFPVFYGREQIKRIGIE